MNNLLPADFYINFKVHSVSWITIHNIKYQPSMVITIGYKGHLPLFAEIVDILLNTEKRCIFIVKKIITHGWSSHICAFNFRLTNRLLSVSYDKLFNRFPTSVQISGKGKYFIVYNDS